MAGAGCAHVVLLDQRAGVAVSLLTGHAVLSRRLPRGLDAGAGAGLPWNDALRDGSALVFPSTDDLYRAYPGLAPVWTLPTTGPVVTFPLTSAGHTGGAVTFGFDWETDVPAADDPVLAEIVSLAAQAVGRAALYETERHSAEVFQTACLPVELSGLGGLALASRYLPAEQPLAIGGDWYDAVALPGSLIGLTIGDVAGHGIGAATVMASLRSAVRAFATVEGSPAEILTRLNTYVCRFNPDVFATVLVAVFDPEAGLLRYASAGHPPPILVGEDGSAHLLDHPPGPPLGLPESRYEHGEEPFPLGSALVLYTDGLVERRRRSLDQTMADLLEVASAGGGRSPDELCDRLAFGLLAETDLFDDTALLVALRQRP